MLCVHITTSTLTQEPAMLTTDTYTLNGPNVADDVVELINQAYAEGREVKVDGRPVRSWTKRPAGIWGNGTMSVDVRTKSGNKVTQVWFKPGQDITVEVA